MKISVLGGLVLFVLAAVASTGGPASGNTPPESGNIVPGNIEPANVPTGDEKPGADITVIYSMANLGYIEPCG